MKNLIQIIFISIITSNAIAQSLTQDKEADFTQFKKVSQHLTTHSEDNDNDGTLNKKTYYKYDQNDNLIKESIDYNNNGIINEEEITTYNNNNQVLTTAIYFGGILDQHYVNVYDLNGLITVSTSDDNADGTIDDYTYFYYNSYELLTEEWFDTNGDGLINRKIYYSYNLDKLLIEKSWDESFNGTIDIVKTYTYDFVKRIKTEKTDMNNSGFDNFITTYSYDAYGYEINIEKDYDEDGTSENSSTIEYNNWNKVVSDISIDQTSTTIETYTYDINGNRTSYYYSFLDDFLGITEYNFLYYFNSDNNMYKKESDHDGDGIYDQVDFYFYNLDLQLIEEHFDNGINAVIDKKYFTFYDALGNKIRHEKDYDNDGNIDYKQFYTYGFINACTSLQAETSYSYKVTIPSDGTWIFSLCSDSTDFDTKLLLGDAECLSNFSQNDDFCGTSSVLEYELTANQEVYVTITGNSLLKDNMFNISVSKKAGNPSGIQNLETNSITIYPNPTSDFINFEKALLNKNSNVSILNNIGKVVKTLSNPKNQMNIEDLSSGIYFLRIENGNTVQQSKFTIK